jgi:hypothetical protein
MNGGTKYIYLNSTMAVDTYSPFFTAEPTSTVINVGDSQNTNGTGDAMIMYCFAPVAGYSSFGSYTGNGSTDGPFVFCGFRPRYLLIKCSSAADNWAVQDTARDTYNVHTKQLGANLSNSEYDGSLVNLDVLSNGFKLRNTSGTYNSSGATYIYFAVAEHPFQTARAR